MRIAHLAGRSVLLGTTSALDIEKASDGVFDSAPQSVYSRWLEFVAWSAGIDVDGHRDAVAYQTADLGTPIPLPPQVFAIGLNYADHAAEADLKIPVNPVVFTKYASSLTGPESTVRLSGDRVDWEAELVVVIGTGGRDIPVNEAWDRVAGLSVGQDLSDRTVQWWGAPAQFSLGKSFEGYAPVGPAVVSIDEVMKNHDRDNLRITCTVQDEAGGTFRTLQDGASGSMLFSVPEIIARLSAIVELRGGDLIFTGTPAGVGVGRKPAEFLRAGQVLTTEIEGVGTIRQQLV